MIFRRSSDVPVLRDYRAYRDPYLRPDFQYRCAYCLTHEFYFLQGDGGEIDHHRPLRAEWHDFSHLENVYSNLYWTCGRCNQEKGNLWPSDAEYMDGFRFLDPCIEDHADHWDTHADGTVTATTNPGRYTIRHLRLDRARLNELRRLLYDYQQKVLAVEHELARRDLSPELRTTLIAYLADIRTMIEPPVFER